jgi:4-hydroxybenzoate polyprenyltransferase
MKKIGQLYQRFNLLSFDVAGGAIASALYFARILHVQVRPFGVICLGLTVWIIYTADHLFDVWSIKTPASTTRHKFHQQHFGLLLALLVLATGVDLVVAFLIRATVFRWGIALTAVVGIYFLIQAKLKFLKELAGAILYSAGILLPSLPVAEAPVPRVVFLLILIFAVTALINLILFSWFDAPRDMQDKRSSLITALGVETGKRVLWILFLLQAIGLAYLFLFADGWERTVVLLLMNLILFFVFIRHHFFSVHDRYRYAGDAVFFLPLIYLFK